MAELTRGPDQIWITRSHLLALAVTTGCIALLSFFLGVSVGRSSAGPGGEGGGADPLVPDASAQQDLEAVLRQAAHKQGAKDDFSFPGDLPTDQVGQLPPETPLAEEGATSKAAAPAAPEPGAPGAEAPAEADGAPAGDVPSGGWSVIVGSYGSAAGADTRVQELGEAGLKAYRVTALVEGHKAWQVRIGGYSSEASATEALPGLRAQLGISELKLVKAP